MTSTTQHNTQTTANGPKADADSSVRYKGYIPALDGLRGVAIALVVFHHFWPWVWSNPVYSIITRVSHISWMGIDVFFVLSGFLISGILLDAREKQGYFKNFIMRRSLRIFPAYYLFLIFAIFLIPMLTGAHSSEGDAAQLPNPLWYFFYGSNYLWFVQDTVIAQTLNTIPRAYDVPEYLGITWSLAVEEQFYLLWPFVIFAFYKQLRGVLLAAIPAVILIRGLIVLTISEWPDATYMASICRADSLMMGACLALYVRSNAMNKVTWRRMIMGGLYFCLPAAIIWQVLIPGRSSEWFSVFGYSLLSLGCVGVLASVISNQLSWTHRIVTIKPLLWLGKYSYGIYLYHMIFWYLSHCWINAEVDPNGAPLVPGLFSPMGGSMLIDAPLRMILCTGCSLICAWLSFHLYEKYFLKMKRFF